MGLEENLLCYGHCQPLLPAAPAQQGTAPVLRAVLEGSHRCVSVVFPQRAASFVSAEEVCFCFGNASGRLAKALVNSCNWPAAASLQPSVARRTEGWSVCLGSQGLSLEKPRSLCLAAGRRMLSYRQAASLSSSESSSCRNELRVPTALNAVILGISVTGFLLIILNSLCGVVFRLL